MNNKPKSDKVLSIYKIRNSANNKKAFSLIELLVSITIIGLFIFGISKIDLSKGSEIEKSLEFSREIQNILEITRNNSLIGKGFGVNLITPNAWKIEIGRSNGTSSSYVNVYYNTGTTRTLNDSLVADKQQEISKIECFDLYGRSTGVIAIRNIYMTGSQMGTDCQNNGKIIKISSLYKKQFPKTIIINSVNGVIEKKVVTNSITTLSNKI